MQQLRLFNKPPVSAETVTKAMSNAANVTCNVLSRSNEGRMLSTLRFGCRRQSDLP